MIIHIITLIGLTVLNAIVLYRVWQYKEAIENYTPRENDRGNCCESLGFIGCSVICSGIHTIEQISRLLHQEYERYEVIVVLDANLHASSLRHIITQYRMIKVNCSPTHELTTTIRQLYRSRQRSFRRLIIVDTPYRSIYDDFNAGIIFSSYDYILPLGPKTALYPRAIENIAIALSSATPSRIEWLYSTTSGTALFNRASIIEQRGFSPHIIGKIGYARVFRTRVPIAYRTGARGKNFSLRITIISLLGALYIATSAAIHIYVAIPIALIISLLIIAARQMAHLAPPSDCSTRLIFYHFVSMIDIFPPRKFLV